MRSRAAKIEAGNRSFVLGGLVGRTHHEHLLNSQFGMVPVSGRRVIFPLEIERGQKFMRKRDVFEIRNVALQRR